MRPFVDMPWHKSIDYLCRACKCFTISIDANNMDNEKHLTFHSGETLNDEMKKPHALMYCTMYIFVSNHLYYYPEDTVYGTSNALSSFYTLYSINYRVRGKQNKT